MNKYNKKKDNTEYENEKISQILNSEEMKIFAREKKKTILVEMLIFVELIIIFPLAMFISIVLSYSIYWLITIIIFFVIVITITLIKYFYMNGENRKAKKKISLDALEKFCVDKFIQKEFKNDLEKEELMESMIDFFRYDQEAIGNNFFEAHEATCLKVLNLEKQGENLKLGNLLLETFQYGYNRYEIRNNYDVYIVTLEVVTQKRLHISNCVPFTRGNVFENLFADYTEKAQKFDKDTNSEKYQLSEDEKEFLVMLHKKGMRFDMVLKDGLLRFTCRREIYSNHLKIKIENMYDIINGITEFLEKFINI